MHSILHFAGYYQNYTKSIFVIFHCGHPPECGSECWDATEEGEGDDDEEEGEEGWHVVAGAATFPCQSEALLAPGHVTHHTATSRVHLLIYKYTRKDRCT